MSQLPNTCDLKLACDNLHNQVHYHWTILQLKAFKLISVIQITSYISLYIPYMYSNQPQDAGHLHMHAAAGYIINISCKQPIGCNNWDRLQYST